GVCVDLGGEFEPQAVCRGAVCVHLGEYARVIRRVDDHGHATCLSTVVLRRCAQHGRPADIDVLDGVGEAAIRLCDGFAEGVKVDHQQIDAVDALLIQGLHVGLAVAACQQASVYLRVQGFDAPIKDLRGTRVLRDFRHRD